MMRITAVEPWVAAALFAAFASPIVLSSEDFYAYFTRIDSGESFERFSRTGDTADLVVHVGSRGGRLVFWRGTSYLPYWETERGRWPLPELTPRSGDGDAKRPDRVNTFSHVHLIEKTPERILVLWRYLPRFGGGNPHTGVSPIAFAEETFEISSSGSVRRTLRKGTARYEDWVDPENRTVEELELSRDGVRELGRTEPRRSRRAPRGVLEEKVARDPAPPALAWRFDEALGDATTEQVTGEVCDIEGHRSIWRRGVSGTALLFDGYTTVVSLPPGRAPRFGEGVTAMGWVALGAYPWNWAPVVQRGDDAGYALGVDGHGYAGFRVTVRDRREEVVSETRLERNRWYHLAGTYAAAAGEISLFVDGRPVAVRSVAGPAQMGEARDPIRIGKGSRRRRPVDPVRANTFEADYGFDGLIDEVRLHDRALEEKQIARTYERFRPRDSERPDMELRLLPKAASAGRFGSRYDHLDFYESWDVLWRFGSYPDVVVSFDRSPARFVFWRGAGYIPMLVNGEEQWYSNEFNETWGRTGGRGCQEPMSDKEAYSNHVRILENTDARVVVHWRYPLKDVLHVYANWNEESGWADWSDWIYTVYPDGVAVKRMRLWTDGPRNHEWHEAMAILGPNQHPEQVLETDPALILADLDGNVDTYSWKKGPPRGVSYRDKKIHIVNYKSELDPFTIGEFTGGNVYGGEVTEYAVFPSWNHWPVAQVPSDGRYSSFPDRTAHSSLTHVRLPDTRALFGDRPYQEKLLMEGLTDRTPAELAVLGRSWLRAPELVAAEGCRAGGHDPAERAYVVAATLPELGFRVEASPERPLSNPCIVVLDWGSDAHARVSVGGDPHKPGPDLRQGVVRDPTGRRKLVVWIRRESTRPTTFQIAGARPTLDGEPLGPLGWARPPGLLDPPVAASMEVEALPAALGARYVFSRAEDGARTSGWIEGTEFVAEGLRPETTYRFRAKARDRYLRETGWLAAPPLRTPEAPPPIVWKLDEGSGDTILDGSGEHPGTIEGEAAWVTGHIGGALRFDGEAAVVMSHPERVRTRGDFTWCAWIKTERDGAIIARAGRDRWERGGKVLFVARGRLAFDAGWVGDATANAVPVADGAWHHVAVSVRSAAAGGSVSLYVDGKEARDRRLAVDTFPEKGLPLKIGYCNDDFPREPGFAGDLDDVRHYGYALDPERIGEIFREARARGGR